MLTKTNSETETKVKCFLDQNRLFSCFLIIIQQFNNQIRRGWVISSNSNSCESFCTRWKLTINFVSVSWIFEKFWYHLMGKTFKRIEQAAKSCLNLALETKIKHTSMNEIWLLILCPNPNFATPICYDWLAVSSAPIVIKFR